MSTSAAHLRAPERADRAKRTEEIAQRLRVSGSEAERATLVEQLIQVNMAVARAVAVRYRKRGVPQDDLEQVAYLALVRAAHGFDPTRGHDFLSYAVPSIRGELRRYFRDQGWAIRPPRRVQEAQRHIAAVETELTGRLGHRPSAAELAAELGEPEADIQEALRASGCFAPVSLDLVAVDAPSALAERLGRVERGIGAAEARVVLAPAVRRLSRRERRILEMRFFEGRSQKEIGQELGVSQTQISRVLAAVLQRLRHELETGAESSA